MADIDVLAHVLAQVRAAKPELAAYAPAGFGWYNRCINAVNTFVPWLINEAPGLRLHVEDVLNSPGVLRQVWAAIKPQLAHPELTRIDELLEMAALLDVVAGDAVSSVVSRHLIDRFPGGVLAGNSKSDYPDLFIRTFDYSRLPVRSPKDKEIGAAVRGAERKPVRVPDGLEIKTSRNRRGIDCHFGHRGLHLILSFIPRGEQGQPAIVDDVLIAFLRDADYHKAKEKTEATTRKSSFSRTQFVSLLPSK